MATHSSILAWEISWTEEPGGLQSMGLQRVGRTWYFLVQFYNFVYKDLIPFSLDLLLCHSFVAILMFYLYNYII